MTNTIAKNGVNISRPCWISLTFDDALHEHLDNVIPALNAARLAGTFYTHLSSQAFVSRHDDWIRAAMEGHELGNHTVFHPAVSQKAWVRPGNAIDTYSIDRMRMELEFASASLSAMDSRSDRTFAYPCSNPFVGQRGWIRRVLETLQLDRTRIAEWIDRWKLDLGSTLQSYQPLVDELFVAGRAGGLEKGQPVPPVLQWQRSRLPSVAVEDWTMDELQQHVMKAAESGTWAILQFHGVGGGHHMNCSLSVFRQFISWLSETRGDEVITVREGAKRLWPCSENRVLAPKLAGLPNKASRFEECGATDGCPQ